MIINARISSLLEDSPELMIIPAPTPTKASPKVMLKGELLYEKNFNYDDGEDIIFDFNDGLVYHKEDKLAIKKRFNNSYEQELLYAVIRVTIKSVIDKMIIPFKHIIWKYFQLMS